MENIDEFRVYLARRLRVLEQQFKNRAEAAKAAGVVTKTYQTWVSGRSIPSIKAMANLAKATGVSLDWIAYGEGQGPSGISVDECTDLKIAELRSWALVPLHELDLSALYRAMEGEVMQLSFMLGQSYERAVRMQEGRDHG